MGGATAAPIELVVTLGLNIPVWTAIANDPATLTRFGATVVDFLEKNKLDGMNFDWEDSVDTKGPQSFPGRVAFSASLLFAHLVQARQRVV